MTGTTSNVTFGNGSEFGAKFSSNDLVCPKFNKVPVKTTAADHKDRFEPKVKGFRNTSQAPIFALFLLKIPRVPPSACLGKQATGIGTIGYSTSKMAYSRTGSRPSLAALSVMEG